MKAHEILTEESKWIRKSYAKSARGNRVKSTSKSAACWCVLGALKRAHPSGSEYTSAYNLLASSVPNRDPISWNDAPSRKFSEVRELLLKLDI